jgi:hypothetical protein
VALRPRWRRAGGCRPPSSPLKRSRSNNHPTISAPKPHMLGSPMTVRGGGVPSSTMAMMPFFRMGPPPRSSRCRCASLHHGLGLSPTEYKDVARTFVHHTRAPLGLRHPDPPSVPACSAPSKAKPSVAAKMRPALTAPARAGASMCGSGRRNGCTGRTKKLTDKKWIGPLGHPLTKISPYKVDDRLRFCRRLHRQVGRLLALEDAGDVVSRPSVLGNQILAPY